MHRLLPAIAVSVALVACQPAVEEPPAVQESGEGGSQLVVADDAEMAAAVEQARASLDLAIAAVPNRNEGHLDILVKAAFDAPDEGVEHVWLVVEGYSDGVFHTWVGNVPAYTEEISYNDEVDVPAEQVTDWMIVEDGVARGAYTERLIVARMSDDERAAFEAEAPFAFSDEP